MKDVIYKGCSRLHANAYRCPKKNNTHFKLCADCREQSREYQRIRKNVKNPYKD